MTLSNIRTAEIVVAHSEGEWRAQAIEDAAGHWHWESDAPALSRYLHAFAEAYPANQPGYDPDAFDSMVKAVVAEIGAQVIVWPVPLPFDPNRVY